ncbi:MAG: glycosyl transferase family 2 [Bdellovibrionota bacterium]
MAQERRIKLSIIVPVGPQEIEWRGLLTDLQKNEVAGVEVIFSATTSAPADFMRVKMLTGTGYKFDWISGNAGRGRQLNRGASVAAGEFLWFLHSDMRLGKKVSLAQLIKSLDENADVLHFFDLKFLSDGPRLLVLNEVGVCIRSCWLGLPFGDQGFALKRDLFWQLGGFLEDAKFGEDHLFVWAARQAGVKLRSMGIPIYTSARKYERDGWLWTTCRHLWLTFRQALPGVLNQSPYFRKKDSVEQVPHEISCNCGVRKNTRLISDKDASCSFHQQHIC